MINITSAVLDYGTKPPLAKMKIYGETLVSVAREKKEIVCLCADLTKQTEVDAFRSELPERFFSMGMAEQNMVGVAAGMAQGGYIPFVNSFSVFLTRRPYDQVAMSIAYPKLNVKLVGMMPGLSSPGGASHQAIDDLAIMRSTPNMVVIDIGEASEAAMAVQMVAEHEGPVYLRLKRGELPLLFDSTKYKLKIGESYLLKEGSGAGIITSGLMTEKALKAHQLLSERGLNVSILHVPSIKPIDSDGIRFFAKQHKFIFTLDNHNVIGGLGSAVMEALSEKGIATPVVRFGVKDIYGQAASPSFLYRKHGMEPDQIAEAIHYHLTGQQEDMSYANSPNSNKQTVGENKGWGGSF
ncbi:MAG TPA: transketolase C-terminal domain-containing protein [Bacilli bacterium]